MILYLDYSTENWKFNLITFKVSEVYIRSGVITQKEWATKYQLLQYGRPS